MKPLGQVTQDGPGAARSVLLQPWEVFVYLSNVWGSLKVQKGKVIRPKSHKSLTSTWSHHQVYVTSRPCCHQRALACPPSLVGIRPQMQGQFQEMAKGWEILYREGMNREGVEEEGKRAAGMSGN